jgi:hypothetical protein
MIRNALIRHVGTGFAVEPDVVVVGRGARTHCAGQIDPRVHGDWRSLLPIFRCRLRNTKASRERFAFSFLC